MAEPSSTEVTHIHNWICSAWYTDLNMSFRQTQNQAQSLKLCPLFWGNRPSGSHGHPPHPPPWQMRSGPGKLSNSSTPREALKH